MFWPFLFNICLFLHSASITDLHFSWSTHRHPIYDHYLIANIDKMVIIVIGVLIGLYMARNRNRVDIGVYEKKEIIVDQP